MGLCLYRLKMKLWIATALFLPLLFSSSGSGRTCRRPFFPAFRRAGQGWDMMLLGYCFVASILPMWLLLQPRGYLGGWMMYMVIVNRPDRSARGRLSPPVPRPERREGLQSLLNGKMMFPILVHHGGLRRLLGLSWRGQRGHHVQAGSPGRPTRARSATGACCWRGWWRCWPWRPS